MGGEFVHGPYDISHVSPQLEMIDVPFLVERKKIIILHYIQDRCIHLPDPYIRFAISLWFRVLKEFVPRLETHVCGNVGGTPGGKKQTDIPLENTLCS